MLPRIERLVAARPTYGYRRITAILNRELRAEGLDIVAAREWVSFPAGAEITRRLPGKFGKYIHTNT